MMTSMRPSLLGLLLATAASCGRGPSGAPPSAPAPRPDPDETRIVGRLLASEGTPAAGATVLVDPSCTVRPPRRTKPSITAADGAFVASVPRAGACRIMARSADETEGALVVVPTFDPVLALEVRLQPLAAFTDHYQGGLAFVDPQLRSAALARIHARSWHHGLVLGEPTPDPARRESWPELNADDPELRRAAAMALASAARERMPEDLARTLLDELDPADPLLVLWPDAPWWAAQRLLEGEARAEIIERVVQGHPNPEVGARLLLRWLEDAHERGATEQERELQRRLGEEPFASTSTGPFVVMRALRWRSEAAAPAPGTLVEDTRLRTVDGDELNTASLRGHPVVLYFMTSWCKPCREGVATLRVLHARHHGDGLRIVIVSVDETLEAARKVSVWLEGAPLPLAHAPPEQLPELDRRFAVLGIVPTWVLLDERGRVLVSSHGQPAPSLEDEVAAVMKGG